MNPVTVVVLYLALLHSVHGETVTINHDQVQPFAQPEPVTISEKAAVKFKPQLHILDGCASFPVVNAAGEISGGLKGTKRFQVSPVVGVNTSCLAGHGSGVAGSACSCANSEMNLPFYSSAFVSFLSIRLTSCDPETSRFFLEASVSDLLNRHETLHTDGCTEAPLGSQVYGRASWYQDHWAIVYAWYFPKNFRAYIVEGHHGWASMVLWLDNPALEEQKLLGASLSQQTLKPLKLLFIPLAEQNEEPYQKYNGIPAMGFVGMQQIRHTQLSRWSWNYTYTGGSNVSTRASHMINKDDWIHLSFFGVDGEFQDLIMWEQLTDEARTALNSADFGDSIAPFTDNNFETTLKKAWPF